MNGSNQLRQVELEFIRISWTFCLLILEFFIKYLLTINNETKSIRNIYLFRCLLPIVFINPNFCLRWLNSSSWQIVYKQRLDLSNFFHIFLAIKIRGIFRQLLEEMNTSRILKYRGKISLSTWINFSRRIVSTGMKKLFLMKISWNTSP